MSDEGKTSLPERRSEQNEDTHEKLTVTKVAVKECSVFLRSTYVNDIYSLLIR